VTVVYLVQHAEKEGGPGDPGLTRRGAQQAARAGRWLGAVGIGALYSSPARRALETAGFVAAATGQPVRPDERLRERLNWDPAVPREEFLADWANTAADRDHVPRHGDSSRVTAQRMRAFLLARDGEAGRVAAVTHGGATVDLLRTLLGDDAVPAALLRDGVPACAITTVDGLTVVAVASVAHL
jgi:broad specificity phosphatase PhoE